MSLKEWHKLTVKEKRAVIQIMYKRENLSKNKIFISSYQEPKKLKPVRKRKAEQKRPTVQSRPIIPVRNIPATETVFEKTFNDRDIDQHGNIKAFAWTHKFQVGDIIEIKADLPETAKEIYIYRGPKRSPKWKTTKKGYFRGVIEHVPIGKYYYIWLEKGRNINVKILITRMS
jgi:hypothetical protein